MVELLAVIGIIAVVTGILLSTVFQTRGRARGVTCISNLRQIQLAIAAYSSDNDGHFPPISRVV